MGRGRPRVGVLFAGPHFSWAVKAAGTRRASRSCRPGSRARVVLHLQPVRRALVRGRSRHCRNPARPRRDDRVRRLRATAWAACVVLVFEQPSGWQPSASTRPPAPWSRRCRWSWWSPRSSVEESHSAGLPPRASWTLAQKTSRPGRPAQDRPRVAVAAGARAPACDPHGAGLKGGRGRTAAECCEVDWREEDGSSFECSLGAGAGAR